MLDRRLRRSADRPTALRYQLEAGRERGDLEAVVLGDVDGLVLAASGDRAVCVEAAAIAPLIERSVFTMPRPPLLVGAELVIRTLELHGQRLFLAAIGARSTSEPTLAELAAGVRRILRFN